MDRALFNIQDVLKFGLRELGFILTKVLYFSCL